MQWWTPMDPRKQRWQSKRKKESEFSTCEVITSNLHSCSEYICKRNKLPSHLGIHCVESLLQQQNLCSNEWKWFWAIWRLSGKSAMLGLQCWQWARAPMVSWQLFLCGYPTYSQTENFPEKLPCSSYLISSLCHLPPSLCYCWPLQAWPFCIWYKYKEMRLT